MNRNLFAAVFGVALLFTIGVVPMIFEGTSVVTATASPLDQLGASAVGGADPEEAQRTGGVSTAICSTSRSSCILVALLAGVAQTLNEEESAVGGAPPAVGGAPPAVGGAPPAVGGAPPAVGGAPPAVGGAPPAVGGAPPAVGGAPPAVGGGQQQPQQLAGPQGGVPPAGGAAPEGGAAPPGGQQQQLVAPEGGVPPAGGAAPEGGSTSRWPTTTISSS